MYGGLRPLAESTKNSERSNPQSEIRNVERVFFLGYFEKKSLGRRLVESKTS